MSERKYKYRSIDTVDWSREPDITGRLVRFETITVDEQERETMVLDTESRFVRVFFSAGLKDCFETAQPNDCVHIEFRGKVTLKKSGRSFNRFNVQVWEGELYEPKEDDAEETASG